jgi:eukaryotic-like serine/threonine-protein kinase
MPGPGVSSTRLRSTSHGNDSTASLPPIPERDAQWVSVQVEAMAVAWARGERPDIERILKGRPGLGDESIIRLVYEDVCLRREAGEDVFTQEVLTRFPRLRDKLEVVMGCDRLLRPLARHALLPNVGDELGPYRLLEELGRGASGKIFLAEEPGLADRLVVLKVMPNNESEHLSLARLQHTHIVPLFSEHTFEDRGLRALCMPYLGGTSLSRILDELQAIPPGKRRGRDILDALARVQTERPGPNSSDGPYRRYLEQVTYVQATCWITACLADALSDTHDHGLLHMDVKPSNVLIAGNGQAMLLDFHLARKPIAAGEMVWDRVGGSLAWMAPEHRAAMESVSLGIETETAVDRRSDLYALGLLLCESLGGTGAAQDAVAGTAWWERNPEVSVGLRDIVAKCLAVRAEERYHNAAELAEDLRLHLGDLPLRGVSNRSWLEYWKKWRRSKPAELTRRGAWFMCAAALTLAVVVANAYRANRIDIIESVVSESQKLRREGRFDDAGRGLIRGLEQARGVPWIDRQTAELETELRLTRRGQHAVKLHRLADLVRFRDGSVTIGRTEEARALVQKIREVWRERQFVLSSEGTTEQDSEVGRAIRTDLFDIVEACGEMLVSLAPAAGVSEAKAEATALMAEATAACGPRPDEGPLQRGRRHLRAGRLSNAAEELRKALDDRPQDLWPNFYVGVCAYRLGRFDDAYAAFWTCVALSPGVAHCYYNRAMAAEALGRTERAEHDYARAIELEPGTPALLNRALLLSKQGRHEEAIRDLRRALGQSADPRTIGRIHHHLALAYLARGNRAEALENARQSVKRGDRDARALVERLTPKS